MDVRIRSYQPSDFDAVLEILKQNTPRYFAPKEAEDFTTFLHSKIDHYFVLVHENEIIGCGGFNRSEDGATGYLSWDLLLPSHQGNGYGSQLVDFRIQKLLELGVPCIRVRTSQWAFLFYQKKGFGLDRIEHDYWAEGIDLYEMTYQPFS